MKSIAGEHARRERLEAVGPRYIVVRGYAPVPRVLHLGRVRHPARLRYERSISSLSPPATQS